MTYSKKKHKGIDQLKLNKDIKYLIKKKIDFEVILFDGDEESQVNNMLQSKILSNELMRIGRM